MALLSSLLNLLGVILLSHAVYSAYEHSLLSTTPLATSTPSSAPAPASALPLDITLETLASILLLCTGIVLSSPALKPIQWAAWAGQVEREDKAGVSGSKGAMSEVGNPYRVLEDRPGFLNIRAKRREFAEWVRDGGAAKAG